jgi:hypothetical protein
VPCTASLLDTFAAFQSLRTTRITSAESLRPFLHFPDHLDLPPTPNTHVRPLRRCLRLPEFRDSRETSEAPSGAATVRIGWFPDDRIGSWIHPCHILLWSGRSRATFDLVVAAYVVIANRLIGARRMRVRDVTSPQASLTGW